jgi:hypothetical protein
MMQKLRQFNLTITEFATNLKDMIGWGGEPKQIVAKFDEMQKFDRERVARKEELDVIGRKLTNIRHEYYSIRNQNSSYSQKIDVFKKFNDLGIDLVGFFDTIMRISTSNGIPIHLAFIKFSQDLEKYDAKLGFESQIESQKSELKSLDFKLGKCLDEAQENEEKKLNVPKKFGISFVYDGKTIEM